MKKKVLEHRVILAKIEPRTLSFAITTKTTDLWNGAKLLSDRPAHSS